MRCALLGYSAELVPLLRSASASGAILATAWVPVEQQPDIQPYLGDARLVATPEEVSSQGNADVVILAAEVPEAIQAARLLVAEGATLVLVPQLSHSTELVYQLGLLRDEHPTLVRVYPLWPWRVQPQFARLLEWSRSPGTGRTLEIEFERTFASATDSARSQAAGTLPVEVLTRAWMADFDLLSATAGEFQYVTAVPVGEPPTGIRSCTVNCGGKQAAATLWTGRTTTSAPEWRLRITSESGTGELSGTPGSTAWKLQLPASSHVQIAPEECDVGGMYWEQIRALRGAEDPTRFHPELSDVQRVFDLLDAAQRSLHKRRTIDVYRDAASERNTFKSQMTALGCGILMLTLLTLLLGLGAGLLAKELGLPPWVMQLVRVGVFLPLFGFLALQGLIFLTRPTQRRSEE